MALLAGQLLQQGELAEAEPLMRGDLATRRETLGDRHPSTLISIGNLAVLLQNQGNLAEAEPLYREVLAARRETLRDRHPDTLFSMNNLATLLQAKGDLAAAEPLYREALAGRREELGPRHSGTLGSIGNLATLLQSRGQLAAAEPLCREALAGWRETLGNRHPDTLNAANNLGMLLQYKGDLAAAEPLIREAATGWREELGGKHPKTLTSINNLALQLNLQGKRAEAEPLFREVLAVRRETLGDQHLDTLVSMNNLAGALQDLGQLAPAETLYREAMAGQREALGAQHPHTLASIGNLATVLRAQGELAAAEPLFREVEATTRSVLGERHPSTLVAIGNLAMMLKAQGNLAAAEPLYRESAAALRQALGAQHSSTLNAIANLAVLLVDKGDLAEGETLFRQVLAALRETLGPRHPQTICVTTNLATLLTRKGDVAEAEQLLHEALQIALDLRGAMSDPSGSSAPVLEDHDGFVESMYHLLWAKDFAGEPCGGILVPDTIIYKYRIPAYWYFTGSDGRLKRKNKSSIVNKKIYADFTRGARGPNDIVACHICESRMQTDDDDDGDEPEAEGDSARPPRQKETVIRHFDSRSLHDFLFHHEKLDDGCLIKFVRPKGLFNSTIQAAWSPQMCLLERRVNIHPLLSGRVPLQQRTATYEGGEHLSNISPVRGTLLADKVQQLCWSIVTHIQATSLRHHKTSRMLLNFKTDAEDNVWFLWCSSIRLYPEEGSEAERLMDISTPKPRPSLGSSKSVASGLLAGGTAGAAGTTNKKGPRKLSASASVAAGMGAEPLSACCINPALSSPAKPPVPKHMRPLASVCPFTSKLLESNHPYFVTYKTVIEYSNLLDARTGRKRPREEIPPLLARVATDLDPSSWLKDRGNPLFLYRRVLVSQAAYLELTTSAMPGMRVLPAISAKEKRAMILGPAKSLPVLPPMAAKLERAATGRIPSAERPGRLERAGTQLPVRLANPT